MMDRSGTAFTKLVDRATRWLRTGFRKLRGRVARYVFALRRHHDLPRFLRQAGPRVLIVTNDLSRSGAPLLVFEMAALVAADGYAPIVVSPVDGPFASKLRGIGVPVVIDPFVSTSPPWLLGLGDRVRWTICNTVDTAAVALALARRCPTLWYLHEVSLLEERLEKREVRAAVEAVSLVWAGSPLCASKLQSLRSDVEIVPYGVAPLGNPPAAAPARPLKIGVFGSIERRKGQDLAVEAVSLLSPGERRSISLTLYGRILEPAFAQPVLAQARELGIAYAGELDHDAYQAAIAAVDAVLVSSRDDTLPIVSIDALGLGRLLLLSPHIGTAAWLDPGVNVLVATEDGATGLAGLLKAGLAAMDDAPAMGMAARRAFDRHFSRAAFHQRLRQSYAILEDRS